MHGEVGGKVKKAFVFGVSRIQAHFLVREEVPVGAREAPVP